jgi:hypothetical protein
VFEAVHLDERLALAPAGYGDLDAAGFEFLGNGYASCGVSRTVAPVYDTYFFDHAYVGVYRTNSYNYRFADARTEVNK